ncbi:MAG: MmcQ/YjbR family DNA-binding protein [Pyrinomonadaceae bacterium]|nr:MmcQ/YjbR family DNA-binding protein [Pyrinomonadaceae bacterium]
MTSTRSRREPVDGEKHVERVRQICLALPETWEKISHGEPTFFVGKRVFAMCSTNHHNDGHYAVTVPAAIGIQAALIEADPKKFYRPPYVGPAGWVGIELPRVKDKELALHLREAWLLIAPEKWHSLIEGSKNTKPTKLKAQK